MAQLLEGCEHEAQFQVIIVAQLGHSLLEQRLHHLQGGAWGHAHSFQVALSGRSRLSPYDEQAVAALWMREGPAK